MGILGYPNMDDDNRDGIFGDYSEIYSNYTQEDGQQVNSVENLQNETQSDLGVQSEMSQGEKKQNGVSVLRIFMLGLLLMAAAGFYLYKHHFNIPSQEQSMGDYFYNQVKEQSPADTLVNKETNEPVAIVEVDLGVDKVVATPSANVEKSTSKAKKTIKNKLSKESKVSTDSKVETTETPLTAAQKAALKAEQDKDRENAISLSNKPVIIPVTSGGRVDPFMPAYQARILADAPKFELIAPPVVIPESDPVVDQLVETKISGIMFDSTRPSAIINIAGMDQLVHVGDLVKGYKILKITKDTVVIQYKANIYHATVGQTLGSGVHLNPASNISNSFGGAYSNSGSSVIRINN